MRWSMTSRGTLSRTMASKRALIRGAHPETNSDPVRCRASDASHRVLAPKLATRDSKVADFVRLATRLLDPDTPLHHHCAPGAEMGAGYAAVVVSIHGVAARMFQVGSILASVCGPVT
jgi:hypothetical protein